jgi:phosphate transport system protein
MIILPANLDKEVINMEIRKGFEKELKKLEDDLVLMAHTVQEAILKSMQAMQNHDLKLADVVIDMDDITDKLHLDIETRCVQLIALQQPMGKDLRTIATVLTTITDLERMGDHTVDIAKFFKEIGAGFRFERISMVFEIAEIVKTMIKESVDAFVARDTALVMQMIKRDDDVDRLYEVIRGELEKEVLKDPKFVHKAFYLLQIARLLERIADHATNIGERIIYMETGELKELNV